MLSANDDKIFNLQNQFYEEFGKLVAKYLDRCPKDFSPDYLLTLLQEHSNVFSCNFDKYSKKYRTKSVKEILQEIEKEEKEPL